MRDGCPNKESQTSDCQRGYRAKSFLFFSLNRGLPRRMGEPRYTDAKCRKAILANSYCVLIAREWICFHHHAIHVSC